MKTNLKYVYYIKCKINNKFYVGETKNYNIRIKSHFNHGLNAKSSRQKYPLYQDILKYGKECFEFGILQIAKSENAIDAEEEWISKLDSFKNGYNMAYRSNRGGLGYKHSEESIEKIKKHSIGSNNAFYGKAHSDQTKKKISIKNGQPVRIIFADESYEDFYSVPSVSDKYPELTGPIIRRLIEIGKPYSPKKRAMREKYTGIRVVKINKCLKEGSTTIEK